MIVASKAPGGASGLDGRSAAASSLLPPPVPRPVFVYRSGLPVVSSGDNWRYLEKATSCTAVFAWLPQRWRFFDEVVANLSLVWRVPRAPLVTETYRPFGQVEPIVR